MDGLRLDRSLAQDAVDAVADPEILLVRLEVEVGGALAHRLVHDGVHEADDGPILLGADDRIAAAQAQLLSLLANQELQPAAERPVAIHGFPDVGLGRDHHLDLESRRGLHFVQGHEVEGIAHGDRERVADLEQRDQLVLALDPLRNETHDLGLEDVRREVHARDAELLLVVVEDGRLLDQIEAEQHLAERLPRAPLLLEGAREPVGGKMSLLDEALAERFSSSCRHVPCSPDGHRWPNENSAFPSQVSAREQPYWRDLRAGVFGGQSAT